MEKYSFGEFSAPPDVCAPIYSWYWNGPVSDEKSALQLDEMKRLGVRAVYIIPEPKEFRPKTMPTELEPDYLTPEYFERFRFAMEYASSLGMRCWLYDEGGWPSGGACGKVLKDHPETARRLLAREDIALPAGEAYHRRRGDAAAAFADGKIVVEGQIFTDDAVVSEYYSRQVNNGGSDYPDLTCRDATDYFLKITHDGYAGAMGDMLGGKISAVFTDEPKAPWQAPFRDELAKAYVDRYGESILPYLPVIAGDREPGEKELGIRRRWYDLCSRFFCDNYLLPCKKWANAHGMAFTGHMDRDDDPDGCMSGCSYHIMRALRCLDIPGVDVIWRQIFPPKEGEAGSAEVNRFYPRYASSAAAQVGSRYAVSESLGVYGGGVTYEQMRYVLAFQAIRGINIFNLMGVSYSREGYHLAGEQPVFDEKLTGYEYLPVFNRFIERLSYLASLGERVCGTALYYPVSDYWGGVNRAAMSEAFDSLGRKLERNHVDFDIADDDIIQSAEGIEEGEIRSGLARYRRIVIPEGAYLPPETREKLGMFVKGGGTVSYSAEGLAPAAVFDGDASDIRVMRRRLDDGDLICLFNQAGGSRDLRVYTGGGAVRLSPDDG
ncbi:MAG: hypothetical protein K6D94_13475, partial [Clostridiales bacterium]|nr:hypothetical protein [Clostridiales bacterium]